MVRDNRWSANLETSMIDACRALAAWPTNYFTHRVDDSDMAPAARQPPYLPGLVVSLWGLTSWSYLLATRAIPEAQMHPSVGSALVLALGGFILVIFGIGLLVSFRGNRWRA